MKGKTKTGLCYACQIGKNKEVMIEEALRMVEVNGEEFNGRNDAIWINKYVHQKLLKFILHFTVLFIFCYLFFSFYHQGT